MLKCYGIVNTLRPKQDGCHFPDDIFKCIFLNENVWILIKISLKFVPNGPINNIPALVQIMIWRRPDDKPLFERKIIPIVRLNLCEEASKHILIFYHFNTDVAEIVGISHRESQRYGLCKTTLHCNAMSHWLGSYIKWSLVQPWQHKELSLKSLRPSICTRASIHYRSYACARAPGWCVVIRGNQQVCPKGQCWVFVNVCSYTCHRMMVLLETTQTVKLCSDAESRMAFCINTLRPR